MKIQCSCGTKFSFDVTPEMVQQPIQFVCQNCGQDSSQVVNQLIRQQFGAEETPAPAPAPLKVAVPVIKVVSSPAQTPPGSPQLASPDPARKPGLSLASGTPAASGSRPLRVALQGATAPSASGAAPAPTTSAAAETLASSSSPEAPRPCSKHPTHEASHACIVCHKPMCPECMQVAGLVCSPFCRTKAEAQGIAVPEYALQRDVAQRRQWRKVGAVVGALASVVIAVLGFWFWYAWFGSVPKVAYAHQFANPGSHGQLHHGPARQLIVLHGGTLARHDLDSGKVVWSVELFDRAKIAADSATELADRVKARLEAARKGEDVAQVTIPNLETITRYNIEAAERVFELHGNGENVWIASGDKLTRYAWTDGGKNKEVVLDESLSDTVRLGTELLFVSDYGDTERALRVDLNSGDTRTDGPPKPEPTRAIAGSRGSSGAAAGTAAKNLAAAQGQQPKPLDTAQLAARAQNLPYPNRAALPATIAAAESQRRTQAAMDDEDDDERPAAPRRATRKPGARQESPENVERLRSPDGIIELGVRMLEEKIVVREAMKAAPKVSALEGTVNAAATVDIANELLNEMQRERGSKVEEDLSRYQVTVRRAGPSIPPWTGEVIGTPSLHPLKTVDVIAAGKGIVVVDKKNKKLWESKLTFTVGGSSSPDDMLDVNDTVGGRLSHGEGPCVERGDTLYVFDQGLLTSFSLAEGTARWRLPSVGTTGIWFDDEGMLYVNTTTATPDSIKYSKQIDIAEKTHNLVLKVDPQTGRTLWGTRNEGWVTYLWGKYVYTAESSGGTGADDAEVDEALGLQTGLEIPAHIRLKRLDSGNGRVLWEHYQKRQPLDVRFDQNTIQLLFKKQFQHLKFVVL